ncbi:multiple epidermal growth factor-like domains protein 10 [Saccostrea echinata]|uniref:multiple epidermal growth factor-like domains protein 10 n=1 Tax=Saccostrea echinata TaxID=191078 RepID=UPI002A80994D|nr:multiple epidermal growth factor-like domains protein 10 [Saccostrea echinata]
MFIDVYMNLIVFCILKNSKGLENLALRKHAVQSSNHRIAWEANKAVDGDKSTSVYHNSCAVTQTRQSNASWYVDLEKVVGIHHVTIYYRKEQDWETHYRGRFAGFSLYVSNSTDRHHGSLCYHDQQNRPGYPTPTMTLQCNTWGRYVIIYNERNPEFTYPTFYSNMAILELCEVEVYGCPNTLQKEGECVDCPSTCKDGHCNETRGTCLSCSKGFSGDYCNETCGPGSHGHRCSGDCGFCRDGEPCDHVTGFCLNGCANGMRGDKCKDVCQPGTYGPNCTKECGIFCKRSRVCHHVTGKCQNGCKQGFSGDTCEDAEGLPVSVDFIYGLLVMIIAVFVMNVVFFTVFLVRRFRKKTNHIVTINFKHPKYTFDNKAFKDEGEVYYSEQLQELNGLVTNIYDGYENTS